MRIDKSVRDDYAILTLKGEFDTFYCPGFQEEVEGLIDQGIIHVILNCRYIKFINSTAVGAIIKVVKRAKAEGGEIVLASPSSFVRNVISTLGIDQIVRTFDEEGAAEKEIIKSLNQRELAGDAPVAEKVLISFPDDTRAAQLGGKSVIVGTMLSVDGERLRFAWNPERNGLNADQGKQLFFEGSPLELKFQVKLLKKGHFELVANVAECTEADGEVKVTCVYDKIAESDQDSLAQFAEDMEFLKRQIPRG